jgi:hypothetical protein
MLWMLARIPAWGSMIRAVRPSSSFMGSVSACGGHVGRAAWARGIGQYITAEEQIN